MLEKIKNILIIKLIWEKYRERKILRQHARVAEYWQGIIKRYFKNDIDRYVFEPKVVLSSEIIWQYWGQGMDDKTLPEVVKTAFDSVDRYKGQFQVIRLTDETIVDYIDLPDFVWMRRNNPSFKQVFFSDLLRLSLLRTYGGVWLDATILLTGPLPKRFSDMEYFLYQRAENALSKASWKASYAYYWNWNAKFKVNSLNSIFFAKSGSRVISVLLDLMLHYWKTEDEIKDYFFFQILYNELIENELKNNPCPIVDDTLPHLLQTKLNGGLTELPFEEIFRKQTIHKLTYFEPKVVEDLKTVINKYS